MIKQKIKRFDSYTPEVKIIQTASEISPEEL